ncbi:MAG: hypothetical protein R6W93_13765 [Candidatus Limnocylindrales bacterium]
MSQEMGMDAAGQIPDLPEHPLQAMLECTQFGREIVRLDSSPQASCKGDEGNEILLDAVVEVAFQAAALLLLGLDEACT